MSPKRAMIVALACTALSGGCAATTKTGDLFTPNGRPVADDRDVAPADAPSPPKTIYVVSHGWHTGLVVNTADIPGDTWPDQEFFADRRFVEIGWGDEGFYRAERITPALAAQAGFWPTPSVLHVVGFDQPVQQYFPVARVIEIEVAEDDLANLCRYIGDTYALDERGEVQTLGPGIYGDSEFYRARGSYYFPNTCNVWTARGLRAAGVPLLAEPAVTARSVIAQARLHGRVLR